MPCEYRMKNYCFHPERANGKLVAINCVYSWLSKVVEQKNLDLNIKNTEITESKTLVQGSEVLG
ncbi:MAG: hypothetical protein KJ583_05415 [Nanoarchaeota archaeon]|nr:hypothetical protein [Nanoarchaeota archaeon]MBU1269076.1 hypothetical protein [Nanoarchaeota archaeon]MBU1604729.1 hypothetical protein [Nanoarchaeota archaeon]MBU2442981.1 hypothetical protein [Nanoarchaeota archaeon]